MRTTNLCCLTAATRVRERNLDVVVHCNTESYISLKRYILRMTDTMGRMHSDAQFAGSSSVKPCGLFLLRTSAEQMNLLYPRFVVGSSTR